MDDDNPIAGIRKRIPRKRRPGGPLAQLVPPGRIGSVDGRELTEDIWEAYRDEIEEFVGISLPQHLDDAMIGCGSWGCVLKTTDDKWVVKVSGDPTEGPMIRRLMKIQKDTKHDLKLMSGVSWFVKMGRIKRGAPGTARLRRLKQRHLDNAWIILRENVIPIEISDSLEDRLLSGDEESILKSISELAFTIYRMRYAMAMPEDSFPVRIAKRDYISFLNDLADENEAYRNMAETFIYVAERHNILFGDAHIGNLGVRAYPIHGSKTVGMGMVVFFDPGHTPTRNGRWIRMVPGTKAVD